MIDRSETIAAFLDGTLDEPELSAFEAELAADPGLAAEVARLADNDRLLREAFDGPMREPVDAALLARMGLAEPEAAVPLAANDNPPIWRRWQWPIGGAIAASLALIAVFQAGQRPHEGAEFAAALEATPSATTVQLQDGGKLTPRLTFAAADGRFCREYNLAGSAGNETGIACREGGSWKIEAKVKGGSGAPDSGEIVAAGGNDAAAIDAAYARLGGSDPLGIGEEKALIEGKWAKQ